MSPDVQAYGRHELERIARDLRAVADELERLAGGNASAEDVDRQVFTAAHLAGDLEVLSLVLAGRRSPPPQICAAGYPLDAATHPPDTIPCAHHPARKETS